ncbi:MAG: hypothetical protein AB4080_14455 [Trichodesmium sp.]
MERWGDDEMGCIRHLQKQKIKSIIQHQLSIISPYSLLPTPYSLFSGDVY